MIKKLIMTAALALSTIGAFSTQAQDYPRRTERYVMPRSSHVYAVPRRSSRVYVVPRRSAYEIPRRSSRVYYRRHHRYYRHYRNGSYYR